MFIHNHSIYNNIVAKYHIEYIKISECIFLNSIHIRFTVLSTGESDMNVTLNHSAF